MSKKPPRHRSGLTCGLTGLVLALGAYGCGVGADHEAGLLGATGFPTPFLGMPLSATNLTWHPALNSTGLSPSYRLFETGQIEFTDAVARLIRDQVKNPFLGMSMTEMRQSEVLAAGGKTFTLEFQAKGIRIAHTGASAHRLANGALFLLGTAPALTPAAIARAPDNDWLNESDTQAILRDALVPPGSLSTVKFSVPHRQEYMATNGELVAVLKTRATINGLPYETYVSRRHGLVSLEPVFLDVAGDAKVTARNILQTQIIDIVLPDLAADGSLTSGFLQTVVPSGYQQANEPAHVFNYPVADPRYGEASSYAHTQDQFAWVTALGFQWYGPQPLQIKLHALPGGTVNNALFIPGSADDGSLPSINIGDGDGQILQNLATDGDVPKHEFGHHVVYQTLKTTTGESLVVHEALADAFVFLHNDDACLGQSICPAGSTACILQGQCLRTGDNNFAYKDKNWVSWLGSRQILGHKHSQVLSGLLWDLRKNGDMTPTELAQLVLKAVSYFKVDSGMRDFLLSVLTADQELFLCKHDAKLRQYIANRNLNTLITDVAPGCAAIPRTAGGGQLGQLNNGPDQSGAGNTAASSPVAPGKPDTKRKGALACAVAAGVDPTPQSAALLLLLGLTPLLLAARPVAAAARTKRVRRQAASLEPRR